MLTLANEDICKIQTTQLGRRWRYNHRTAANVTPGIEIAVGALLVVTGAYSILDADQLGQQDGQSAEGGSVSPGAYQLAGGAVVGAGVAAAIAGLYDRGRLEDSNDDLGEVALSSRSHTEPCNLRPIANQRVTVQLGASNLDTATNAVGEAAVSLLDIPENDLPGKDGVGFVVIDGKTLTFTLESAATADLERLLAATPESRLSRDRATAAQKAAAEKEAVAKKAATEQRAAEQKAAAESAFETALADAQQRIDADLGRAAKDPDHDQADLQRARSEVDNAVKPCAAVAAGPERVEGIRSHVRTVVESLHHRESAWSVCNELHALASLRQMLRAQEAIERESGVVDLRARRSIGSSIYWLKRSLATDRRRFRHSHGRAFNRTKDCH